MDDASVSGVPYPEERPVRGASPREREDRAAGNTDPNGAAPRPRSRPPRTATDIPSVASFPVEPATGFDSNVDADASSGGLFGPEADTRRRPRRERKPATAMQRALGLLTRREHSRKELTRKLVSRGVDTAEVEAAVGKLTDAGWQDDRRFAESLVRSRASSGYGPLHIRAELGTHDLPSELRQAVLDEFEGDWTEIARDLVERRFGRIDDRRARERKAADYLVRRGFPGDIVRAVVRSCDDD